MQAPIYPITGGAMTHDWFPVPGWALPNALGNVGLTLGAAATGPVIAWLMLRYGWRMSFVLTAPIAFVLAAVWWWYVRDKPSQHPSVRPAELALIDAGRPPLERHRTREIELSWILEDNAGMRGIIESIGGRAYKRYRVYERELDAA